jgi:hypothetical protein
MIKDEVYRRNALLVFLRVAASQKEARRHIAGPEIIQPGRMTSCGGDWGFCRYPL